MNNHEYHFLTGQDLKHFKRMYLENAGPTGDVSFDNFKEIVLPYNKFSRPIVNSNLDKIKKRIKESSSSDGEDIVLSTSYYQELIYFYR